MISGWIHLALLKPAASEIIGVLVTPPGTSTLDGEASAVEVLGHNRAERFRAPTWRGHKSGSRR
jgi:hypothetical protein